MGRVSDVITDLIPLSWLAVCRPFFSNFQAMRLWLSCLCPRFRYSWSLYDAPIITSRSSFSDDEEKERDGNGNRIVSKNGSQNVLRSSTSKHSSPSRSPTAGPRSQSPDLREILSPSNKTRSPRATFSSFSTHAAPNSKSWAPATRPSTAKPKSISRSVGVAHAAPAPGHLRPASAMASSSSAYASHDKAASGPQSEIARGAQDLDASLEANTIRFVKPKVMQTVVD